MDWRRGGEKSEWKISAPDMPPLSDEEKAQYAAEMEARKKTRDEEIKALRGEAAKRAKAKWAAATPISPEDVSSHKYLKRKKLGSALGARQLGNNLIIPIYAPSGELVSLQTIPSEEGARKDFLTHGRTHGCFCILAEDEATHGKYVFVCEGWATGVTIHEATGCTVIVAFYAGNLRSVTATMLERYPGKLVLAPDNDLKTRGNPGMTKGFELEEEFDIPLAIPPFENAKEGTDWNDYAALHDIEATAEAIYSAVEKWEKRVLLERGTKWPVWVDVKENGNPRATIGNLEALLRRQAIDIRYDEIRKRPVMTIPNSRYCQDGESEAQLSEVVSLCAKFGLPDSHVPEYLSNIAMKKSFNPVREWVGAKAWDGTDRLEEFYDTVQEGENFSKDFKKLILRRWLISCVAAAFSKGDFHNRGVLVLQGKQEMGKTSWLSRLVPPSEEWFFSSTTLDMKNKDDVRLVLGYWIVELAELEGIVKLDLPRLKAFLTLREDEMRLPYGRGMTKYGRRTVFCASVNQYQFLRDATGNSRWWVIPCRALNYQHKIDIQQLWAQVRQLWADGERWYFDKEESEELERSNWMFEQPDEIDDLIRGSFDWDNFDAEMEVELCDFLSATEVLRLCKIEQPTTGQAMKAGEILRELTGRPSAKKHGGKRSYLVPRFLGGTKM
jgi:putative DNA primase/helicase